MINYVEFWQRGIQVKDIQYKGNTDNLKPGQMFRYQQEGRRVPYFGRIERITTVEYLDGSRSRLIKVNMTW